MSRFILILLLISTLLGCNNDVVDYSYYDDSLCVENLDSTYRLFESGKGERTVYLNIHCTASREGADLKGTWFLDFFKNKKNWSKPGYNEIVELDGTRFIAVPYNLDGYTTWNEVSYGVAGHNSVSINVAYVGGVDQTLNAKDTRTAAQKRALDQIVYEVRCAMPWVVIMGHRDHPGVKKNCPSFNVGKEYGRLNPFLNNTRDFDYEPNIYKDSVL